MRVYYDIDGVPRSGGAVVTVGSFDGVHRGHKALLRATVEEAARRGVDSIAVTFWPHPRKVLKSEQRTWLLSPLDEKLELIAAAGIDKTVVIPFDEAFSRLEWRDFVDGFIRNRLGASAMVVGYDHRFGHNKDGGFGQLQETRLDIIRIPEQTGERLKISSTEVRNAVSVGDIGRAAIILGHRYFAIGAVRAVGRGYCFKTSDEDKLMPCDGQYPVSVTYLNEPVSTVLTVTDGLFKFPGTTGLHEGSDVRLEFL